MPIPYQGKSVLQTQDPYHIPGYLGHVPQFKYSIGDTYAKSSHKLLLDKNITQAPVPVLAEIHYKPPTQTEKVENLRKSLVRSRTQSWGDQKLREDMVPGYTGFVPKQQNYFGARYAEVSLNATADFENTSQKQTQRQRYLQEAVKAQSGKPSTAPANGLPHRLIAKDAAPYIKPQVVQESVFKMAKENPEKFAISGYKGFVPRERYIHGCGTAKSTHLGYVTFNEEQATVKEQKEKPVNLQEEPIKRPQTYAGSVIYPACTGLIPKYKGYVPGQKFRFGQRFFESTENALQIGTPNTMQPKRVYDCPPKGGLSKR